MALSFQLYGILYGFLDRDPKYSKFLILYVYTGPAVPPGLRREIKASTYVHLVTVVIRYFSSHFSFHSHLKHVSHSQDEAAS